MRTSIMILLLMGTVAVAGCDDDDDEDPSDGSGGDGATSAGGSSGVGGQGAGVNTGGGGQGGSGGQAAQTVCERWLADRADMSEGSWSGSVASCDAGDISADGRANALKLVNLYRWMVGLDAVTTDGTRDQNAQQCALMMDANGDLSHSPPPSWTCYSSEGDDAAGKSNIATTPGVAAVDLYMVDPGNANTMGHRRWILSDGLGPVGLGSTDNYSCMWVIGGSGSDSNPWTAWPPPGEFPIAAVAPSWSSIDDTGWTIQSDDIDLSGAQVTITDGGDDRPVDVSSLASGYGSSHAIKMIPQGWTTTAGHTYEVSVTGISSPIDYQVEVVDCQ